MSTQLLSLVKGQKIDLTKGNANLSIVHVGCGWKIRQGGGDDYDLDASVMLLEANKKLLIDGVIFFNHQKEYGIVHGGDNLKGADQGDAETIKIDLQKLPAQCNEVVVFVNIFEATKKHQNFGMVQNAFIRIYDPSTQLELARYDLSEDFSSSDGAIMGKFYRYGTEWKFQALGVATKGDINEIVAAYPAMNL